MSKSKLYGEFKKPIFLFISNHPYNESVYYRYKGSFYDFDFLISELSNKIYNRNNIVEIFYYDEYNSSLIFLVEIRLDSIEIGTNLYEYFESLVYELSKKEGLLV